MCSNIVKERCATFIKDDSGAVTVDFVVLTAAVVFLGVIVASALGPKVTAVVTGISL